jgi:phospho-N-acetylmuramoyl-pentapeptide-transferase
LIQLLQRQQIRRHPRRLQDQAEKKNTAGGLIILLAILVPVLLFAKLENIYAVS